MKHRRVVGKEPIHTVRLKQQGAMRTQPGQKWLPMVAEQSFTTTPPAYLWHGTIRLFPRGTCHLSRHRPLFLRPGFGSQ